MTSRERWTLYGISLMSATLLALVVCACAVRAEPIAVRLSDLNHILKPPNPIVVWGTVTNDIPTTISDGHTRFALYGVQRQPGQFITVVCEWVIPPRRAIWVNTSVEYDDMWGDKHANGWTVYLGDIVYPLELHAIVQE